MGNDIISTSRKAHIINDDPQIYGTFAEIGAGQEVARHFFQAGHASMTVAKTMSAYDMKFSDEIYGKAKRYVSQDRLDKMLDHEFTLLTERLENNKRCFFAFANTVATSSHEEEGGSHAWMGLRFQLTPDGPTNDIVVHVRMLDRLRLLQQEALGVLGVNLVYGAWYLSDDERMFVSSLIDNITTDRIEIDYIRCSGPGLQGLNQKLMNLELLVQKMTPSLIFSPGGQTIQSTDYLYGKPVLVLRGTFKPITNINLEILKIAEENFSQYISCDKKDVRALLEFTISNAEDSDNLDYDDYLSRIETINSCGLSVLVSRFPLFYQLKSYLRRCTNEQLGIVIGSTMLSKIFNESFYKPLKGGALNAFGKLFDSKMKMMVFPYQSSERCETAATFNPEKTLAHLYRHLYENNMIVDIAGCEDVDTSFHSEEVRKLLEKKDSSWVDYVPQTVCELIQKKKLFGYK